MEKNDRVDVAVIGAGWHGLTFAKTYHEAYPNASIRIFDNAKTVGGVWAEERCYPSLKTNNVVGSYEFSDFPMTPSRYGLRPGQHIHGLAVHRYLTDAADYFDIARYLCLDTQVVSATLNADDTWTLTHSSPTSREVQLQASRLVVATGLTSEPYIPTFDGQDCFMGLIIHSRSLNAKAVELAKARSVAVVGGNKSAWDVCYSVASAGGQAHMILRPSGGGPSAVWPTHLWPFNKSIALLSATRFYSLFDPWPFADGLGASVRQWLHRWTWGQWLTMRFWDLLGILVRRSHGYANDSNTAPLAPWSSVYWMGNSLSTHNYDTNWFELARRRKIQVHVADITSLSEHTIHLDNKTVIPIDALVCCTGWKAEPPIKFQPLHVLSSIGIPGSAPLSQGLQSRAREKILLERPFLVNSPIRKSAVPLKEVDTSSKSGQCGAYRLFRYVVPADPTYMKARNLAFMGMHLCLHTVMVAQAEALWVTAYFNGSIAHLSQDKIDQDEIEFQTALHTEYERLRRPRSGGGHGGGYPDVVFDSIPLIDLLLKDLKLHTRRKKGAWANLFEPYRLRDYTGLVQEWKKTIAKQ